jgi:hypothetical protein
MQARRRSIELSRPVNVDRRRAFMDIVERLALGVTTVAMGELSPPRPVHNVATPRSSHALPHRRRRH